MLLDRVANATGEGREQVLTRGVVEYLKSKLRDVNAEAFEIRCRYEVASSGEMDDKYRRGELEEAGSWRDFFRLSHLEEQSEALEKLLEDVLVG